jgi:hypothetical protein
MEDRNTPRASIAQRRMAQDANHNNFMGCSTWTPHDFADRCDVPELRMRITAIGGHTRERARSVRTTTRSHRPSRRRNSRAADDDAPGEPANSPRLAVAA